MNTPLFEVYTSREAAELWGLSDNTVTQWCNRGKFTPTEAWKSGGVWLVTKAGMERLRPERRAGIDVVKMRHLRLEEAILSHEFNEIVGKAYEDDLEDGTPEYLEIEKKLDKLRQKIKIVEDEMKIVLDYRDN